MLDEAMLSAEGYSEEEKIRKSIWNRFFSEYGSLSDCIMTEGILVESARRARLRDRL